MVLRFYDCNEEKLYPNHDTILSLKNKFTIPSKNNLLSIKVESREAKFDLLLQQIFIEHFLYAGHCSKH